MTTACRPNGGGYVPDCDGTEEFVGPLRGQRPWPGDRSVIAAWRSGRVMPRLRLPTGGPPSPPQRLRKSLLHCGGYKKACPSCLAHTRDQLVVVREKALGR